MKITILKLGGSIITQKNQAMVARDDYIEAIAKRIAYLQHAYPDQAFIVTHGSGSFGHFTAEQYDFETAKTSKEKIKAAVHTRLTAAYLHNIVISKLVNAGATAMSIAPSNCMVELVEESQIQFFSQPFEHLLPRNIIPCLYGDVIMSEKHDFSICSTEHLIKALIDILGQIPEYSIERVIMLTDVDGVYVSKNGKQEIVDEITQKTFPKIEKYLIKNLHPDVTGGMLHKVEMALWYAESGTETWIVNGENLSAIEDILVGKKVKGTVIR